MGYPSMVTAYQQTRYNVTRCADRRKAKAVRYVVVHNTGTSASAKNNCVYFGGGNRNASADYFIDADGTVYKFNANCAGYYTWHCGDGYGRYGITNANSIGIECVSAGKEFAAKQQESLRRLVTAIMADYGVPASNVVRHYDASRKACPAAYCGGSAKDKKWKALHDAIVKASSTTASASFKSYTVKVTADVLNVRAGAGTSYKVNTTVKKGQVYTIVAEKTVSGAKWGQLKSGAGWICLAYTEKC